MTAIRVASQLTEPINAEVLRRVSAETGEGTVELITLPRGVPADWPREADVFVAAPFRRAGGDLPAQPPGWPFNLRWVQLISVGIDFYPDWLFDGPVVTAAKRSSATALAEFSLAAIFAAAKRFPEVWIRQASDWRPTPLGLVEGATLGIVGFGGIGQALAPKALALGMKVVAIRRGPGDLGVPGVERVDSVAELFARADHVVLAAPATAETHHLVNRAVLAQAKPGLHIVNVARGALIDDQALLEALGDGRVSLATLDVTHPEPLPDGHPYYSHPRVRLSPHTSVFTPDTHANLAAQLSHNLIRFRRGEPLEDVVDLARGY
ncbi:D-isomer specific 2-hydroxyacid dehydrogenase family protein [Nitrospirillum iridis]|uniref:Phosphoglycerate dehydrogenase-like enzyme n=1 Tax=Nitrospirillum iridis TaxID=765888 RepID=A0A7X0EBV3_9PROT|nr:D-isomer specific 2-hydroxyacid dehydrogenase family protein [Nitrospirillum iridis]MBB6251082.1 phosphoglycerate dehydrogenase-like enzyme [Nitrospirillum iridis]